MLCYRFLCKAECYCLIEEATAHKQALTNWVLSTWLKKQESDYFFWALNKLLQGSSENKINVAINIYFKNYFKYNMYLN